MLGKNIFDTLSGRAPTIIVVTLCVALAFYWAALPEVLPCALAIAVCALALMLMATRDRRQRFTQEGGADPEESKSWIAYELAGKGTPAGSYVLGFFALVTIILTGIQGAYALPAWAALVLCIAWSIANARYPAKESSER